MRLRFAALAVAMLVVAGCPEGRQVQGPRSAPTQTPGASVLKAALLTPGPISDAGWNALAWDGLELVKKELGAQVEHVQQGDPKKFEDDLKDFAERGAKIVFAHGFEYQDACEKVAAKYPDVVFVVASGVRAHGSNVACLELNLDEGCYLAGVLAAHLTKTKKVGCVGGIKIPPVENGFIAFANGAKKARPDVEAVAPAFLGTWDDVAKGKEQALALVAAGCDVILHNADHAGLGVFDAAKTKGVLAIGSNRDQNGIEGYSDTIVASATADIARCMLDLAREVKDGKFTARKVVLDAKSGYVDLKVSPALAAKVPAAALEEVEQARKALVAGTLKSH